MQFATVGLCVVLACGCSRTKNQQPQHREQVHHVGDSGLRQLRPAASSVEQSASTTRAASAEQVVHFAWQPSVAAGHAYALSVPEDQHRILLTRGVRDAAASPVVVAFHGQPRRGQAPRTVHFVAVVSDVVEKMVEAGQIAPVVLVLPTFRFEGQNWPQFSLDEFLSEVQRQTSKLGIETRGLYVFGHSGAAGCGGGGLNSVTSALPNAVGFFDTCVGAGFVTAVRELERRHVPTLIVHSVETAGWRPRNAIEYDPHFDFGKVYRKLDLAPVQCPRAVPDAPLRKQQYRCAVNESRSTEAYVVDTGTGEAAHEALVPVAVRYFLRRFVGLR